MADRPTVISTISIIQLPALLFCSVTNLQLADIHDPNSNLTNRDKCPLVKDKVINEISQSDEPALPRHCTSDEALLISLVGYDHLIPNKIDLITCSMIPNDI